MGQGVLLFPRYERRTNELSCKFYLVKRPSWPYIAHLSKSFKVLMKLLYTNNFDISKKVKKSWSG